MTTHIEQSMADRFWSKVRKTDTCWEWTAGKRNGYGAFAVSHRRILPAHRVSWELSGHELDPDLVLDHICRNRSCVNPDHLEQVSNRINVIRGIGPSGINARKTHCKNGHEFTPENTYVGKLSYGTNRVCRACARDRENVERAEERAEREGMDHVA